MNKEDKLLIFLTGTLLTASLYVIYLGVQTGIQIGFKLFFPIFSAGYMVGLMYMAILNIFKK